MPPTAAGGALDNDTLTSIVRQLAVQNKLLQEALADVRGKQEELTSNQSLITSTLMSDLSRLTSSSEIASQEIKFLKEQHMTQRSELQSHLKYLDDHLAKAKEEMLLLANQVVSQEKNSKAWTEHMTKAFDFVNQDSRDRGVATAKLSEKILRELNTQRLRSDEIESQFKSTVREMAIQQAQANASAMSDLQNQLEVLLGSKSSQPSQIASNNTRLSQKDTLQGPHSPRQSNLGLYTTSSDANLNHNLPSADQRFFHQSVRSVTDAYQDTIKGELATMRTQLTTVKLSLEERFAEQSRQVRSSLQGMKVDIDVLKSDFLRLTASQAELDSVVKERVTRVEEVIANFSDGIDTRLHKVQSEVLNLGDDCTSRFGALRTNLTALQTRLDQFDIASYQLGGSKSNNLTKKGTSAYMSTEVQREINRLSRDFKDLVSVMRETHVNQNKRIEQVADQLQSQLVSSLSKLRHLDQTRAGILWPQGRFGSYGSNIIDNLKGNETQVAQYQPILNSYRQNASLEAQHGAKLMSIDKSEKTASQKIHVDKIASKRWFSTQSSDDQKTTSQSMDTSSTIGAIGVSSRAYLPKVNTARFTQSTNTLNQTIDSKEVKSARVMSKTEKEGNARLTHEKRAIMNVTNLQTKEPTLRPSRRQDDALMTEASEADASTEMTGIISSMGVASAQNQVLLDRSTGNHKDTNEHQSDSRKEPDVLQDDKTGIFGTEISDKDGQAEEDGKMEQRNQEDREDTGNEQLHVELVTKQSDSMGEDNNEVEKDELRNNPRTGDLSSSRDIKDSKSQDLRWPTLTASMLTAVDQGVFGIENIKSQMSRPHGKQLQLDAMPVVNVDIPMVKAIRARGGNPYKRPTDDNVLLDEDGEIAIESILLQDWASPNQPLLVDGQNSSPSAKRRKPFSPAELASLLGLKISSTAQSQREALEADDQEAPNIEVPLSAEEAIAIATAVKSQFDAQNLSWSLPQNELPPLTSRASTHEVLARKQIRMRQLKDNEQRRLSSMKDRKSTGKSSGVASDRRKSTKVTHDIDGSQINRRPEHGDGEQNPSNVQTTRNTKDRGVEIEHSSIDDSMAQRFTHTKNTRDKVRDEVEDSAHLQRDMLSRDLIRMPDQPLDAISFSLLSPVVTNIERIRPSSLTTKSQGGDESPALDEGPITIDRRQSFGANITSRGTGTEANYDLFEVAPNSRQSRAPNIMLLSNANSHNTKLGTNTNLTSSQGIIGKRSQKTNAFREDMLELQSGSHQAPAKSTTTLTMSPQLPLGRAVSTAAAERGSKKSRKDMNELPSLDHYPSVNSAIVSEPTKLPGTTI